MKYSVEALNALQKAISEAQQRWYDAIKENLKEIGEPVPVGEDIQESIEPLVLDDIDGDGDSYKIEIDKVRYNPEYNSIEFHYCCCNYKECDEWNNLMDMNDLGDYALQYILWDKIK